ncbi:hypothetical protein NGRA_2623 [Nosema granulosis]|uniref:Uncharacterized protein n=1 Tax=Nosema granulosis TaxID=83296 RepID=A0A9P6KXI8_9MICR|nr:hypothetical protein NGRA_2623 [Nosema granulosis]
MLLLFFLVGLLAVNTLENQEADTKSKLPKQKSVNDSLHSEQKTVDSFGINGYQKRKDSFLYNKITTQAIIHPERKKSDDSIELKPIKKNHTVKKNQENTDEIITVQPTADDQESINVSDENSTFIRIQSDKKNGNEVLNKNRKENENKCSKMTEEICLFPCLCWALLCD